MFLRRMARLTAVLLALMLFLGGCGTRSDKFSRTYWDYFDTFATITGYAASQSEFDGACELARRELERCHRLFDIYNEYEGLNNIAAVNKNAGLQPVEVDGEILSLMEFSMDMAAKTGGALNVAMGAVLRLWHDCRDADVPYLPDKDALAEAYRHCHIEDVIIDRQAGTLYLADPLMSLDVGAAAKGRAVELAAQALEDAGYTGFAVNVGGNLRVTGDKPDGQGWSAGVQDPFGGSEPAGQITLHGEALATSGTYQRYFELDGVRYHHIIDPDTLYPGTNYQSVSVCSPDAGLADALSTALFNMNIPDGLTLIESFPGTQVMWITDEEQRFATDGFSY